MSIEAGPLSERAARVELASVRAKRGPQRAISDRCLAKDGHPRFKRSNISRYSVCALLAERVSSVL